MALFAKLQTLISGTAGRALNKGTMIATTHALGWAVFADGKVEDDELESAMKFAKNHPKLKVFGGEFNKALDSVISSFEDSPRMAKVAARRAIADFAKTATHEEKEDLTIALLDLFESDGNFDADEQAVADEISTITGYDWKQLM